LLNEKRKKFVMTGKSTEICRPSVKKRGSTKSRKFSTGFQKEKNTHNGGGKGKRNRMA